MIMTSAETSDLHKDNNVKKAMIMLYDGTTMDVKCESG